jgi:uncharacterized protein (DUF3084 family)
MAKFDEDEKTQVKTPTMGHFYALIVALVVVLAAAGFMFYMLSSKLSGTEEKLSTETVKETGERSAQDKVLDSRVGALESAMTEAAKKIGGLTTTLDATRKELADLKNQTDQRLTELAAKMDENARATQAAIADLGKKIEDTRTEFAAKTDEINATLTRVKEDSQFIIAELGKKAEKAYMRFMERKLDEKITAVDAKVDTVKGDLEQQIGLTKQRIEQVVADMGQSIKKTVEESVKIDFVPSASDKEEE